MPTNFDAVKDLLLEDYRYRAEDFRRNEQLGETRVNLFVGFAGALLAVLGFFIKDGTAADKTGDLRLFGVALLFVLCVLGVLTLFRLIIRDSRTDDCKRDLDAIRQTYKDLVITNGALLDYYPVATDRPSLLKKRSKRSAELRGPRSAWSVRSFGGLSHLMAVVNSLLIGGLAAALLLLIPEYVFNSRTGIFLLALPVVCAGIAAFVQVRYVNGRRERSRESIRRSGPSHAGGVICRMQERTPHYLIVGPSSSKGKTPEENKEWVLPKGHIEDGEGHAEAAVREVAEETGMRVVPVGALSLIDYATPKQHVLAKFYLMQPAFDTGDVLASPEHRPMLWRSFEMALELLSFPESKLALRLAEALRASLVSPAEALPSSKT